MPISLSRSQFHQAAVYFYRESNADWQLHADAVVGHTYLQCKHNVSTVHQASVTSTWADPALTQDDPALAQDDPAEIGRADQSPTTVVTLDYHILFSPSYQVPVLYLDAFFTDGRQLTLDDLYRLVIPPVYKDDLQKAHLQAQGSVTQADHPILGRPFWYVHPCDTQTLLRTLSPAPPLDAYMKTWLSLVGPVFQCPVPLHWFHPALPIETDVD
ncbi:hypothetical protein DM01DRAFT_1096478 [Hesseltinella vesiculosa]|uniref:Ubiquitin-like-conjugating enzyme ATG10 n=1 Tax=Hesseltinella vesiculosa TaxID=101127 RepID=A0A1X2GCI1_9FUNG|nr:hypothetical protein DM01DRAFT_1096478 [Hesseltinella vesiculosa]